MCLNKWPKSKCKKVCCFISECLGPSSWGIHTNWGVILFLDISRSNGSCPFRGLASSAGVWGEPVELCPAVNVRFYSINLLSVCAWCYTLWLEWHNGAGARHSWSSVTDVMPTHEIWRMEWAMPLGTLQIRVLGLKHCWCTCCRWGWLNVMSQQWTVKSPWNGQWCPE